jgi:hypothetical protein
MGAYMEKENSLVIANIAEPTFSWKNFWAYFVVGLTSSSLPVSLLIWWVGKPSLGRILLIALAVLVLATFVGISGFGVQKISVTRKKIRAYDDLYGAYSKTYEENEGLWRLIAKKDWLAQRDKDLALEEGQKRVIASLLVSRISNSIKQMKIGGLLDINGTVHMVLQGEAVEELRPGMRLEVRTSSGDELRGVIEIIKVSDASALAYPIDRAEPRFWEYLEDKMTTDSSPPSDVELRPYIMDEVVAYLGTQPNKAIGVESNDNQ